MSFPPGFFRNGTTYMTQGRWFDGNLVRWHEGALQPVGGWSSVVNSSDSAVSVDQPIRGMLGWKADNGQAYLAMGSYCKAWALHLGILTDITPGGIGCGTEDAQVTDGGAYGDGIYGAGPYGGVISDATDEVVEVGSWQFDTWGELLLGNPWPDNTIYEWDLNVGNNFTAVTNAPSANAIVVTPEQALVALGANGDRRLIAWSDLEDRTVWTATSTNMAGDFPLPGSGDIMAGRRGRNETLIWTETDTWTMRFIGGEFVYQFVQVGANCGIISRRAMGAVQSKYFWMGRKSFFVYDGFVNELPSEVSDYVFNDFNIVQRSKVACVPMGEYGEIWWFYPSGNSVENDRYVVYNDNARIWYFGKLPRTDGIDRGSHQNPIWAKVAGGTGLPMEQEKGDGKDGITVFAETGPIEIGNGDSVMQILKFIPDDKTVGDVSATLHFKNFPDDNGSETVLPALTGETDVRVTGRSVRVRITEVRPNWRWGTPRLDVAQGGRR
jgi:hypothetical protein